MVWGLLAAVMQSGSGCELSDACDFDSEDYTECHGSRAMVCKRDSDVHDGFDWSLVRDCAKTEGMMCRGGECRPAPGNEPCPHGSDSVCRGDELLDCVDGMLAQIGTDCSEDGYVCSETVGEFGMRIGLCAVDHVACTNEDHMSWDCRDGAFFLCHYGRTWDRVICQNSAACVIEDGVHACPESAPQELDLRWRSVPSGTFHPGTPTARAQSAESSVDTFEMMQREVTVAAYQRCVASHVCEPTANQGVDGANDPSNTGLADLPVTLVTEDEARRFCRYVGGRLPDELEWEYAMRNAGRDITYPWGDAPADCRAAVIELPPSDGSECPSSGPQPGCSREADVTDQGVCDLVGNVSEITEGFVAGGSFTTTDAEEIYQVLAYDEEPFLGFRCIRDPVE